MTQVEVGDEEVMVKTLIQAQLALQRQGGPSASLHISRLQRMIDQLIPHDFLEHSDKNTAFGKREQGGGIDGGVWALGRYWTNPTRKELESGTD